MTDAPIQIPADLLPADGRFGCGPSKVRPEAVQALASKGTGILGTSHRQAPVRDLVGRVDHSDLVGQSECLYDMWYGWEGACGWDYGYWYAQVRRSVYIEDNLFTVSDYGVKVNDLNDPGTEKARVVFYPQ